MTTGTSIGRCILGTVAAVLLAMGTAGATHDEPPRAKGLSAGLVTAYDECTGGNTQTQGAFPVEACSPPARSDSICGFGVLDEVPGKGRLKAKVDDGEVDLSVSLAGLAFGCEGQRLCGVMRARVSTHRCDDPPCTTVDVDLTNGSPAACCTVVGGTCRMRSSVPEGLWDALRDGERAGIEVLACGVRRVTGPSLPGPGRLTFACGLLAP